MKKQFVNSLQEGDVVNDYFIAARKDLRDQANGNKFLGMVFKDKTGDVGGILWNNAQSVARLFEAGDVVNVRGVVTSYQERLQIRVDQVLPLREGEYKTNDLVDVPADISERWSQLRDILCSVTNQWLRQLIDTFLLDETFVGQFSTASAGKKWHHAQPGGLVRHCYEVSRIAMTMAELFPEIDRDLLLTVVFLHDVGKLREMSHDLFVDYTTEGKLIGHLQIGCDMIREKIDKIPEFPANLRLHILHCILAHHGEMVNGSPVVPKTLEAMVLYHADNLDAQADAVSRVIRETRERRQEWSEYLPLIDRQIWVKDRQG